MATQKLKLFVDLLQSKKAGDRLSRKEILDYTGWAPATFATHVQKNKLTQWLLKESKEEYIARMSGNQVLFSDVAAALRQVTPVISAFGRSDELHGEAGGIYTLSHELGRGATAHVWMASQSNDNGTVAVKICEPRPDLLEPTHLTNVQQRFRREAANGRKFSHDCVIQVLDKGEHADRPFTVLEMAHESLSDVIKASGPISIDASLPIINRCLSGLAYVHSQGCVHRDIKPANILRAERGYIIADLGIVQWDDMSGAFTSAGTITNASLQLGSWYYMSPEQCEDPHVITTASDVYSLGVTWYEILTGRSLDPRVFVARAFDPPTQTGSLNDMITRMVEYKPENRPSIEELAEYVTTFAF